MAAKPQDRREHLPWLQAFDGVVVGQIVLHTILQRRLHLIWAKKNIRFFWADPVATAGARFGTS
jgi:hypothetical protein